MKTLGFVAFTLSPVALFALLQLGPPSDAPARAAPTGCQTVTAHHPAGDLEVSARVCLGQLRLAVAAVGRRAD